jgi:hypothetical protein
MVKSKVVFQSEEPSAAIVKIELKQIGSGL